MWSYFACRIGGVLRLRWFIGAADAETTHVSITVMLGTPYDTCFYSIFKDAHRDSTEAA